ncbi:unnamed protein product [Boreogadus saida]
MFGLKLVPCIRPVGKKPSRNRSGPSPLEIESASRGGTIFREPRRVKQTPSIKLTALIAGPHIASVTLAAYECGSVDFPEPPYPESILCPQGGGVSATGSPAHSEGPALGPGVSLWTIMSKVRLEACMWGAGTAIGELPPYFMARAARLSGADPNDQDYQEFEEMMEQGANAQDPPTLPQLCQGGTSRHLGKTSVETPRSSPHLGHPPPCPAPLDGDRLHLRS